MLYLTIGTMIANPAQVYSKTFFVLQIVQSSALLEIFHSVLKMVKSSPMTTVMQVSSRLFIVWFVLNSFPKVQGSIAVSTMILAWSITEIVRYSFYFCALIGNVPFVLLYLRYTLFYILYPLGAGSEFVLVILSMPYSNQAEYAILGAASLVYAPGFYVMFSHMIKQRRNTLTSKKSE